MRVLTNDYRDCELINLGLKPGGRGPYAVRQDGYPSGSETLQEDRFLLRKDGTWVLNFAAFLLTEEEQEAFIYGSVGEVLQVMGRLAGRPVVKHEYPPGKSKEELLAAMDKVQSRLKQAYQETHGGRIPDAGSAT